MKSKLSVIDVIEILVNAMHSGIYQNLDNIYSQKSD